MLKRTLALILVFTLLAAVPTALASEYYSARTPLAGSGKAKLNNIELAVEAINGTYIPYGESFSFNETVGRRTTNRGFQKAPNGRGVMVTGGGVAQVASTLYLALLQVRGDIEIDPVKTYGSRFNDNYVTDVSHAIITDYDADIDLSFTNNEDDMTIDMWANDKYVYCSITVGEDTDSVGVSFGSSEGSASSSNVRDLLGMDITGQGTQYASSGSGWFFTSEGDDGDERELLGSASLDCGGDKKVLGNVELAAESVNDTTLEDGDVFSFNEVVGPRYKKYGYVEAINGRGAKVTGGGVAQVASVLWLAVKDMDDISIVEKSTYGSKYNQSYVDSSSDAILTDYSAGRDFSFRYTGDGSITIYTYVTDGWLYCEIYGE